MELPVINAEGRQGSPLQVSDATFGAKFNEALIHQVVVAQQAGARAGTRAQKNRAAVRGGGRKPYRQKGTGRARAGTRKSTARCIAGPYVPSCPSWPDRIG